MAWIEAGLHATATATGLELSRLTQPLVGLWIVAVAVPLVTWVEIDPVVVHRVASSEIWVVSGLVGVLDNGGVKVIVPVTLAQVMLPVATAPPITVLGVTPLDVEVVEVVVVDACVVLVLLVEVFVEQPESTATSTRGRAKVSDFHVQPRFVSTPPLCAGGPGSHQGRKSPLGPGHGPADRVVGPSRDRGVQADYLTRRKARQGVRQMPARLCLARSYRRVVLGSAWPTASWTSRRLAPASDPVGAARCGCGM